MLTTGLHAANFKGLPNLNCKFTSNEMYFFVLSDYKFNLKVTGVSHPLVWYSLIS